MALIALGGDCSQVGLDGLGALFQPEMILGFFSSLPPSSRQFFYFSALCQTEPQEQVENVISV